MAKTTENQVIMPKTEELKHRHRNITDSVLQHVH